MARVDPEDDDALRYIVRHYRYDPQRHERRHVDVAAFDNEREYQACVAAAREEIERRRRDGEPVDPREHVSGVVQEPGYRPGRHPLPRGGPAPAGVIARSWADPGARRLPPFHLAVFEDRLDQRSPSFGG